MLETRNRKPVDDPTYRASPTFEPLQPDGLSPVLARNIEALCRRREEEAEQASFEVKIADAISRFTGSMLFVYLHLAIFGVWIIANLGWIPDIPK